MTTTALRASNLSIGYRSPILPELNIAVEPGEMVCLLGPNGIGKSTLLRTLSRIQPALSGIVEIGGVNIQSLSQIDLARRLGVVLTERVAVGALSGRQIVELGRYPHIGWAGRLTPDDHEVVSWAIEASGAAHLADRDINKLSDGERQRLMIARALAQEPLILILDEPTAFLDVPSRVELMGLLRQLARKEHLAIIISTHDLELALRMADTVWLMMPGGRLESGVPEDLILSGLIDAAFRSENITFRPEERVFHPVVKSRGTAIVKGGGLEAALARAVLEREGYSIVDSGNAELTWDMSAHRGESFADLAKRARKEGNEPCL
jgi:iron complex transport system ATP-binding protein